MAMTNAQEQIGSSHAEVLLSRSAREPQGPPGGATVQARLELELPGGSDDDAITRGLLADAILRCGKSREEVAGRMSFLLSLRITAAMLSKFTAETGFPFAWTRAFCAATDDWRLVQHLAEQAGFLLLDRDDADLVSLGELAVEQERARREIERHANNIIARRAE